MKNNEYLLVHLNKKQIAQLIKWVRVYQLSNFTDTEKKQMSEIRDELESIKFIK